MNLIFPWKNGGQTAVQTAADNLVNLINFSLQRLSTELTDIDNQLNHSRYTAEEITAAMGEAGTVLLAYRAATLTYVEQLATILNITPNKIIPGPTFAEKLALLTDGGYLDGTTGIRVKGGDKEMKERWSPQVTSVLNLISLGTPGSTEITFTDFNDVPQTMTFDAFRQLMARFTVWFSTQFWTASNPLT